MLSQKYEFSYAELREAIVETFENRKTSLTVELVAFEDEFINDPLHIKRWNAFLKKKKAMVQVSMQTAIDRIKAFVLPVLEGTEKIKWNPEVGEWR